MEKRALAPAQSSPKRRSDSEATRNRILDCAEQLFADSGYHATSVRDIASLAGCQFALVGYHFGSKLDLLDHVITRRSSVLNEERIQRLIELRRRARGKPIQVRAIVEAFAGAILEKASLAEEGWPNYTRLIASIAVSAEWSYLTDKHFNAVAREYVGELRRSLPNTSDESLHLAFFYLLGAMCTVCARPDRVETLSGGRFSSREVKRMTDSLCTFLAAGVIAVAEQSQPKRKRAS